MKSIIRNLLLLISLFVLGTLLLGIFNPGITVKGKTEISSSLSKTWDVYADTSHWNRWKFENAKLKWSKGRKVMKDAEWAIRPFASSPIDEKVEEFYMDSLMVITSLVGKMKYETRVMYSFSNGKTLLEQEEFWETESFLDNIQLNYNKSSLEKALEIKLDSLKQWIEVRSRL